MDLVRKQTYITLVQDRAVKQLAQQQGTTEAEIRRKTIDQFLGREGLAEVEDPFAGTNRYVRRAFRGGS